MTREQAYDAVIARMRKPENREKYQQYLLNRQESDDRLSWHLKRMEDYLRAIQDGTSRKELFESDFDVSIRKVMHILKEQGWN